MKKAAFSVLALALLGCSFRTPPPTDAALISAFESHRATFDALVSAICADGFQVVSMSPEWSRPERIPRKKREAYYEQLRVIGAVQIQSLPATDTGPCFVQISFWSEGLGGSGDYKDYQYRPTIQPNDHLVSDLDSLDLGTSIQFYYREIAPDWYISFRHWP